MLELTRKGIKENAAGFEAAGIKLPAFDVERAAALTASSPVWVNIGTGNLFKAFHAMLAQTLLDKGLASTGVVAVAPNDRSSIDAVFTPHDNLWITVVMKANGDLVKTVCASAPVALACDPSDSEHWKRLQAVFSQPSLQMVTLAVTEKAYAMTALDGSLRTDVTAELALGPCLSSGPVDSVPSHLMLKLTALLYGRWRKGGVPLALVSTDNFSHNGDRLRAAVLLAAKEWNRRALVEQDFVAWLSDTKKVSFPLSMIDKITPFPSEKAAEALKDVEGMGITKSSHGSPTAAFVNTEEAEYLVIEDDFPNGRPALEKVGVYFTTRETVDKVERMKVCTCLNPLHTALAIFGCLLGYKSISAEMGDKSLCALVTRLANDEGLPVVTDPGIIKPVSFLNDVLTIRLPNPNIPDTPQRIACDTSQKLGIRFGETIKTYAVSSTLNVKNLTLIPLVIAGWCRYLLGVDDEGKPFTPSSDPLLGSLQTALKGVTLGKPESAEGKLKSILSNEKIFGSNLYAVGLGEKIEGFFKEMLAGPGSVRSVLERNLGDKT